MKIECFVIDAEAGVPTVIEYNDILYFQHPQVKEEKLKSRYHNTYPFRRN